MLYITLPYELRINGEVYSSFVEITNTTRDFAWVNISNSTGEPHQIPIEHGNIANSVLNYFDSIRDQE